MRHRKMTLEHRPFFVCLIFFQAVNDSCYQNDDSVLKSLVEIADTVPKYLRPHLEATLQLSLKVNTSVNVVCYFQ